MLEKVRQRMRTAIMMTIPVAVLPKTLKRVPVEAVIQDLQVEAPEAAPAVEAPVAVNQTADQAAAPVAVVQATAVPVVEVNLAEVAPVAAVPVAEVNLAEAALVAENLPVVKVQNNV